jgi:ribonuclease-3
MVLPGFQDSGHDNSGHDNSGHEGFGSGSVVQLTQQGLEDLLGFHVADYSKYQRVFCHVSAVRDTGCPSYERYEFIGDSVLNFVVAKYLFDKYPQADEGFLTRIRTKMVCSKMLSALAWQLGLHRFVTMNHKALRQKWNENPRILEDVFESLVGCIYLDLGLVTAKTWLLAVMDRFIDWNDLLRDTNYKDILMRSQQARGLPLPVYEVLNDPQVTRKPNFLIRVTAQGATGQGADVSKKGAEQMAAFYALHQLGALP